MERRGSSSSTTKTRGPGGDGREPTSWDIGPPGGLKAAVGPLHEEGGHGNRGNLAVEEVRRCEEGDRLALSTLVSGDVLRSSVTNTGMAFYLAATPAGTVSLPSWTIARPST